MKRAGIVILLFLILTGCNKTDNTSGESNVSDSTNAVYKVTMIELGSDRCIPCQMTQPVLQEISNQYLGKVRVLFYDVWTTDGRPYAQQYHVNAIPTQVFLDSGGNEYFRHIGFFPKEEVEKIIRQKLDE